MSLSDLNDRSLRSFSRRFLNLSAQLDSFRVHRKVRSTAGAQACLIPSHTKQRELTMLYDLASNCPPDSNALEIGSHLGASTCYIAAALSPKRGHLFCVDTWHNETMPEGEQDTFEKFKRNTLRIEGLLTLHRKLSSELIESDLTTPLSFAFIDGDHSYSSVKADFGKVSPWIQPGGVVAFHDTTPIFPGVPRVVGEALATGEWTLGGFVDSLCWIVRS